MGRGNFHIILTLWRLQVSLKFHGGENLHIILTLWRLQVRLKFHGEREFSYHLSFVEAPSQFDVPWGWEF